MTPASTTDSAPKSGLKWQGCVGLLGLLAGLCTIFGLIVTVAEGWQEHVQTRWPETTARVEKCYLHQSSTGRRNWYYIDCHLSYTLGAEKFVAKIYSASVPSRAVWQYPPNQIGPLEEWVDVHPHGTPVAVRYDPENPKKAVLVATDMPRGGPRTPANLRLLGLAALSSIVLLTIARLVPLRSAAVSIAFALGGVSLLFATLTSAVLAQEMTQKTAGVPSDEISCTSNSGNPVFLESKWFHLVPAAREEAARVAATKPVLSAPFEARKYPYDHIEIFLEKTNPREGGMYGTESTLSIYARAKKGQTESWFVLSRDNQDMTDMEFMQQTPADNPSSPDQTGSRGEGASFALKDRSIPVISVSWFQGESGANAYAEIDKRVVLDFRKAPPSVMGILQCVFHDGGGACTAPDSASAPKTAVECNWDATRADFLCTSTETGDYVLPYTHRLYMGSGEDAPYEVKQGEPPNL